MERLKMIVREAVSGDAPLIARIVCMAVGYSVEHPIYPVFLTLAKRVRSQYSYRNVLICEVEGVAAGAIVGYDGARLKELRQPIYPLLERYLGEVPHIEDETDAGEYYLDSLGVLEEYRGMGVGAMLIEEASRRAFDEGYGRVGLIVDYENPNAERLYASLGFVRIGSKSFLGHKMWHMQRSTPYDIRWRVLHSPLITHFQRQVYLALLDTHPGETITYGELARRIGCRSAQAVGQALRRNPFAPDVPCHRVVAADGGLGGYNGRRSGEDIERKRQLLAEERFVTED
ncbi:MAG: GNAT family N-acetyltransferase [Alistipes sp.]|nr:GNAT family N-acetyltransferase [Alistipes sp.]